MSIDVLRSLALGFRERYLDHATLTAQVQAWAREFPRLVRLESIGRSGAGRDLWMLTIGPEPDRIRPAMWIDGNMHATELCGSSAALAIAEDAIRMHLDPAAVPAGLPAHVGARLRDVVLHVLPRMSPDGAEEVLASGRALRSVPRDERPNRGHARWIAGDVDGDGQALLMRREDPAGEFVASAEVPGLLVPRELEDPGPWYKVWPEGVIERFDGEDIPEPAFLADNDPDLNRNFPYRWAPEPEQAGAGRLPLSEPESRAVAERVARMPEIFAWLDLHTFGGAFLRPCSDQPDSRMDKEDLAIYRQLGAWAEVHARYPLLGIFEGFLSDPGQAVHGDIVEFAYRQRGCLALACELWDLFEQVGLPRRPRFGERYAQLNRQDLVKLARWDAERNAGRALRPWRRVRHPQLGEVEVGGLDRRVGLWNPPYELIDDACRRVAAVAFRMAALAPAIAIAETAAEPLGGGLTRVTARVENRGYLPTNVLSSARRLPWNEPLHASVAAAGCALVAPGEAHREIGHLEGWGHGRFDPRSAPFIMRGRGGGSARALSWTVRGQGTLTLRVGACRVGHVERRIEVG